jgi:uncharacterized membrane protein
MAGSEAGAVGGVVSAGIIAAVGGVGIFAWLLYRIIRGWLRLSENQPI